MRTWMVSSLFLDWFHQFFVLEVWKYIAWDGLPFKVLWILDGTPGYPELPEFDAKSTQVVLSPSDAMCMISLWIGGPEDL